MSSLSNTIFYKTDDLQSDPDLDSWTDLYSK